MTEWNIETALNHHAGCSVYDDGACTCGFRSRRERTERSPLAPGEGTWSVFAQKVVRERDALKEVVENLKDKLVASEKRLIQAECERDASRGMEQAAELRGERLFKERERLFSSLAEAKAKAETYEKDWYEAKSEFGTATAKLRAQHREEVARLRALQEELVAALSWYVENDDTNESPDNQSWLEGKARAQAAIAKAKSHEE
jgi:hypothetical protein